MLRLDSVFVDEFGYLQPLLPIVLALIYEEYQELLDLLIDPFCLAIGCGL